MRKHDKVRLNTSSVSLLGEQVLRGVLLHRNNYGEKGVDLFGADAVAGDISRISNIISSTSLQSSQQSIYLLADSPSSKLV